jgi:hypothetical protein
MEEKREIVPIDDRSPASLEHPLLAAGFSPQLPARLARLNEQLSLIDKYNETTQWKSITVTLTPDPKYPKLAVETQYEEKRKVAITLFPSGKARFSIRGQAPNNPMPDLVGVVGLSDMQDYVRKYMNPKGSAALCDIPEFSKDQKESVYTDFLELTQETWETLDCRLYALNFLPGEAAVTPFPVGQRSIRCGIYSILYEGSAPDVEKALEDFIVLLEHNPPGKL